MIGQHNGGYTISRPDGRQITYREIGKHHGTPILAFHGTPGSGLKFAHAQLAAVKRNQRLISIDRWGYGGTDAHKAPSLHAFADDIEALLDSLGLEQASVIGVSGGAPYATAVAAAFGPRIQRLALVAPVGEVVHPELSWRDLRPLHAFCFRILPRIPGAVRLVFELFRVISRRMPSTAAMISTACAAPSDKHLMRQPALRQSLGKMFADGLRRGTAGAVIDMRIFCRPWDISPTKIKCPTKLWIGSADRNIPIVAAKQLARDIPAAKCELLDGEGHFWIVQNFDAVLAWLDEP